jgi:hypothetical protein
MRKEFKMTLAHHLNVLKPQLIPAVLICLAILFRLPNIGVVLITFAIICLPALFLHIEYCIRNQGMWILYEDSKLHVFRKDQTEMHISRDQISRIELVSRRQDYSMLSGYFFYKIFLVNGEIIYATSLLNDDRSMLRNVFAGIPFKEKKRFICTTLF